MMTPVIVVTPRLTPRLILLIAIVLINIIRSIAIAVGVAFSFSFLTRVPTASIQQRLPAAAALRRPTRCTRLERLEQAAATLAFTSAARRSPTG